MVFKEDGQPVTVEFYKVKLTLTAVNATNNEETPYTWEMNVGYINP